MKKDLDGSQNSAADNDMAEQMQTAYSKTMKKLTFPPSDDNTVITPDFDIDLNGINPPISYDFM